jgi:hypothetical protein
MGEMIYGEDDIKSLTSARSETGFLNRAVRFSWVMLILAILYQCIFFPEIENIMAMVAVVFAWVIATRILLRAKALQTYLISTFTILGFVSTQFYFPLMFTTMENKPLIYNLELPEQVFLHSTLCLTVIILSYLFYKFLMRSTPDRKLSLLARAGFFDPPSHLQLWLMGIMGMGASFYVNFANPDVGRGATGDPADKFLQALAFFMYSPFFIPLSKLFGNPTKPGRTFTPMILFYAVLLFGISVAQNSRGTFMFGLTTPAFAYALGLLLGIYKTRILTLRNVLAGGVIVWVLTGPFSDLGTAMVIVREHAKDVSPGELVNLTLEALDDKKAIEALKKESLDESPDFDWDERYLNNIFTARFANIKFNDASLITYSKVGPYDPDMLDFSIDQILASLPTPVLKAFNFDVDKETLHTLSFGDYLYVLSGGYGTPTGWRVGHVAGTGMATLGWWYLAALGVGILPMFYLNDKLFRPKRIDSLAPVGLPEQKFIFSFCGVISLTSFFQLLLFESVFQCITYLMRGWIQMVLLYFVMFHVSRLISLLISPRKQQLKFSPD